MTHEQRPLVLHFQSLSSNDSSAARLTVDQVSSNNKNIKYIRRDGTGRDGCEETNLIVVVVDVDVIIISLCSNLKVRGE